MGSKINLKARIKRHSRVLKENFSNKTIKKNHYGYNIVIFIIVFLIPVYPTFASLVHNNTVLDFYRGDIDEGSIISSYFGSESILGEGDLIAESKDSFISINTLLDDNRDLSGTNEIIDYEVKPGDNISKIAYKFRVSTNSIYWANGFSKKEIIHPGDEIKIPPVSGLIHEVQKGESLSSISKDYDVDKEKILTQNLLTTYGDLQAGDILVIPGAIKKVPVVVKTKVVAKANKTTTAKSKDSGYYFANKVSSEYLDSDEKGIYKLTRRKPQHTFYRGNCTWYVAQYKNVNWGGNAKDWFANAKAKGHSIGYNPGVGAIIVFNGKGYNPRYGHVGIVVDVKGEYVYISDMNYRKLGEITYRKILKADRSILGYIYVD